MILIFLVNELLRRPGVSRRGFVCGRMCVLVCL